MASTQVLSGPAPFCRMETINSKPHQGKLMFTDIFTRTSVLTKLEAGPFGPYLPDLVTVLQQQRYATHTIQKYLHSADAFGRWLKTQQVSLSAIDEDTVNRYISTLKRRKVRSGALEIGRAHV